jgi:hypothetical protein
MTKKLNVSYEILGYVEELKEIAYQNYVIAKIAYKLKIFYAVVQMLHESIEKYLKLLWIKENDFCCLKSLNNKLKKFNHSKMKVYHNLSEEMRFKIKEEWKKVQKIKFLKEDHEGYLKTRYPGIDENNLGIVYSTESFYNAISLILKIRDILGVVNKRNLLDEYKEIFPRKNKELIKIIKKLEIIED